MDKFEEVLSSIAKPSSCADKIPEGSLEPVTQSEVEEAYRKDLDQVLGKLALIISTPE